MKIKPPPSSLARGCCWVKKVPTSKSWRHQSQRLIAPVVVALVNPFGPIQHECWGSPGRREVGLVLGRWGEASSVQFRGISLPVPQIHHRWG